MKTLIQLTLYSLIISSISFLYGKEVGYEELTIQLETKPSITTKTHYLMCISKPLEDKNLLTYPKKHVH